MSQSKFRDVHQGQREGGLTIMTLDYFETSGSRAEDSSARFSAFRLTKKPTSNTAHVINDTTNQVVDLRLIPNSPVLKSTDARNLPERPKPPLPRVKPRNLISVIVPCAEARAASRKVAPNIFVWVRNFMH